MKEKRGIILKKRIPRDYTSEKVAQDQSALVGDITAGKKMKIVLSKQDHNMRRWHERPTFGLEPEPHGDHRSFKS